MRNGRLAGFFYALDNIGGFGGVADRLNAYNTYLGDPGRITTDFLRYEAVTPDDLRDRAGHYLAGRPRVVLEVVGRKSPVTEPPLDRSVAPSSAPALEFRAPVPEVLTLRCGLPLWVIPRRDLPIVAASVVLAGGAARQGQGEGGLADLAASMMDEGTATRSSFETRLAGRADGDPPLDQLRLGRGLRRHPVPDAPPAAEPRPARRRPAQPGVPPVGVGAGSRPDPGVAPVRARQRRGTRPPRRCSPPSIRRATRYHLPIDGEEGEVARLTRDDVLRFHERYHGPSHAACVVAGDVDPDAVARLLDDRLAGWSGPEVDRTEPPAVARGRSPKGPAARPPERAAGGGPGRPRGDLPARPRLHRHARPESDPGRPVHLAAERKAARGEGVHVRRPQPLRLPPGGRAVLDRGVAPGRPAGRGARGPAPRGRGARSATARPRRPSSTTRAARSSRGRPATSRPPRRWCRGTQA